MKKLVSILLYACIMLSFVVPAYAAADSQAVQKAIVALGIITGDEHGNLNLSKNVTRAEFAKMMIAASVYKDTVQEGSGSSSFKDVKHTHWASDYIKTVVAAQWMTGYVNGTFKPDNSITYEEAASATLKLLGYGASDLTGTYPKAQISKFASLKLAAGISPAQGRAVTRNECMHIFYNLMGAANKNGQVYAATLGYTISAAGEIDYAELIKSDIEGPFIIRNANLAAILPFGVGTAAIYRNGKDSAPEAVGEYDVVYYNANTKAVWVYSNRAIGTFTAISPNAVAPASVTVAGNSYKLGTSAAKSKVSATGEFVIGDTVALLLGMDGDVVDIISASAVDGSYYGIITKRELITYAVDATKSISNYGISVACTDGVVRQCLVQSDSLYSVGNIVSVSYAKGKLTLKRSSLSNLSGTVSLDGKKLGDYKLAADIEILDISREGAWAVVLPARIAGAYLDTGKVYHHTLNEQKEISHLILNDVTGDMYAYGILTEAEEIKTPSADGLSSLRGSYKYVIDGASGTLNTTNVLYNIDSGPTVFYYKDGQINGMKNLSSMTITELTDLSAASANQKYKLAESVQVYLRSDSRAYNLVGLSAINTEEYALTGYYDAALYPAGGQIRVIIAVKK